MTQPARRPEVFSNPFFVILLAASVAFLLTTFGYLVSPYILAPDPARPRPRPGSIAMAGWLDRHGPLLLGVEVGVMLVAGLLAMITDPWFSRKSTPGKRAARTGAARVPGEPSDPRSTS